MGVVKKLVFLPALFLDLLFPGFGNPRAAGKQVEKFEVEDELEKENQQAKL